MEEISFVNSRLLLSNCGKETSCMLTVRTYDYISSLLTAGFYWVNASALP